MMLFTLLTDSNRAADEVALGTTALLKVASRAAAVGMLAVVTFWTWSDLRRGLVIRQLLPWLVFGAWAVMSTTWSPLKMFSIGQAISLLILLTLSYCTAIVARRVGDTSYILLHICL